MADQAALIISAPIEIGPSLILKEFNRSLLKSRRSDLRLGEFLKASLFGTPPRRAENIKTSHRGYDFRRSIAYFALQGWDTRVLSYGPLPLGTWYGNSQVYLMARKRT